jgi:hypothetical protein
MYLKIDKKLYNKITNITMGDYEKKGNYIPSENIMSIIEDLVWEIEVLKEKYRNIKQDMEDNYKRVSISEQVEINDNYFV